MGELGTLMPNTYIKLMKVTSHCPHNVQSGHEAKFYVYSIAYRINVKYLIMLAIVPA